MSRRVRTLSHWGAYDLTVVGGEVTEVSPLPHDPEPSPIGSALTESGTARVARPAVRRSWLTDGPGSATRLRGEEPFVEVSWDEALDLVAAELDRVRSTRGNEAIFAGSYGWASAGRFHHAQSQLKRFLTLFGGFVASAGTYSHGAAEPVVPRVLGMPLEGFLRAHRPTAEIADHTELFVSFGGVPTGNTQITSGGAGRHAALADLRHAAARGCRFVSLSPTFGPADADVDAEWLALRPGSDVAVMLALVHELLVADLADRDFLDRACSGAEVFVAYVLGEPDGQPKDAAWAATLSELPEDRIRALAHELVEHRSMVNGTWSIQRAEHGEQAVWALIALGAGIGQLALPGGGVGFGYGSMGSVGAPVCRPPAPSLPGGGTNPVRTRIPVARIADMLLEPGGRYLYDGEAHHYPAIDLVYWAGGNPYHHHQDLERLARAWQVPSTIVVHEPYWTGTARRADVVLPTTIPLERRDLGGGSSDDYLVAMEPASAPYGDARDDHAILAALADRLGFGDRFTEGRSVDDWLTWLYDRFRARDDSLPDYATFRAEGAVRRTPDPRHRAGLDAFLAGPDAAPLRTPTGRIQLAISPDQGEGLPPHPQWVEPTEWLGRARSGQLHLVSPQPRHQLHSQYDWAQPVRSHRDRGRARVSMHPADAEARGLTTGDVARLTNDRGRCYASVEVTEAVRPGVVVLPTGAWWDRFVDADGRPACRRGNPNVLTRDIGTSCWAQGTAAHSCLVEVERADGVPDPEPHGPPLLEPREGSA